MTKTKWVLGLFHEGHPPKYLTDYHGLTKDIWKAKDFLTEEQAQMFKDKFLSKSLPNIKPTKHEFEVGIEDQ